MDDRKLSINQDRANKLAKRTRPIVERNQHHPVVASIGAMVTPLADAYTAAFTALKTQRLVSRHALSVGRSEIAALHARLRLWRGLLARELSGFELAEVGSPATDPDGVLADAATLVTLVQKQGGGVVFAATLIDDLTGSSARAEQAWSEAQAQLKQLQDRQTEVRTIGTRFLSALVTLRIALRETLGSQDRDHLALRAHPRAADVEMEDDEEPAESAEAAAEDG